MLDTKKIKSIIDTARNVLVGKVPNPVSQIDLITIAMIYKFMDDMDNSVIQRGGKASFFKNNYDEKLSKEKNDELGNVNLEPYAWHKLLSPSVGNEGRITLYSEALEKLQTSKQIPELFRRIFKGAFLPFRDGATLTMFLKEIDKLSYDNSENLGNGFEYLLSIMGSQGDAGQFRTPRHIIDFIVDVVNPSKDDTILDPACGTAGFLISTYKHILKHNSEDFNPETEVKSYASKAQSANEVDIEIEANLNGDKLSHSDRMKLMTNIKGYDISPDMQKLALVNLYLHGFKNPDISEYDTLTQDTKWKDSFDVIFANPPFMTPKGGIQPHKKFSIQANRSEVLFVDYIIEHLNLKGKAGIIVPEGIIFQSQTAYKKLRKLIQENYLYAVVSLPSGIFQPYSGVKTSILLIDREIAKKSDSILFVDVKNDGYDLGAQRRAIDKNDLTEAFYAIKDFQEHCKEPNETLKEYLSRYEIVNLIKKSEIAQNDDYNLSGSRYAETVDYSNCKWEMVKLGDVCETTSGGTPLKEKNEFYTPAEIPWICSGEVRSGEITSATKHISKLGLEKSSAKMIPANSVLVAMYGATAGQVGILRFEASTNQAICSILPNEKFNPKFLYYILSSKTESLIKMSVGGAQPNISQAIIKNIEIPLPPLEVQDEIVKELDTYQAVIDGAKKVVENWKPTLQTKPSWEKVLLNDLIKLSSGDFLSAQMKIDGEHPVYGGNGINGFHNKFNIENSTVVIGRVGAYCGCVHITKPKSWVTDNGLYVKEIFKPTELKFLALTLEGLDLNQFAKTGGQPSISQSTVLEKSIFLPSIEEQKEIVAKIEIEEQAVEQCKKLIKLHEQKISNKIKSIWGEGCE